jgi:hypothetical protein
MGRDRKGSAFEHAPRTVQRIGMQGLAEDLECAARGRRTAVPERLRRNRFERIGGTRRSEGDARSGGRLENQIAVAGRKVAVERAYARVLEGLGRTERGIGASGDVRGARPDTGDPALSAA